MISKGSSVGSYAGTKNLTLERDERFPIRCTVQHYNVTDSAKVTEHAIREMKEVIEKTYITAVASGSLVCSDSDRHTEPVMAASAAAAAVPLEPVPFVASSDPIAKFL